MNALDRIIRLMALNKHSRNFKKHCSKERILLWDYEPRLIYVSCNCYGGTFSHDSDCNGSSYRRETREEQAQRFKEKGITRYV